METTEVVSRVVAQARRHARPGSVVDEQAWFDAGEPDTVPNVPRQPARRAAPGWLLVVAALALISIGYSVGFYLGRR